MGLVVVRDELVHAAFHVAFHVAFHDVDQHELKVVFCHDAMYNMMYSIGQENNLATYSRPVRFFTTHESGAATGVLTPFPGGRPSREQTIERYAAVIIAGNAARAGRV
jgi:hypothetical protein